MNNLRRFIQCDVFSTDQMGGNPLAVVVEAEGLSDDQMQRFANWTNLAETTFLLPPRDPGADYRVRIFTPRREMKFAGHPTLGSCAAWLATGGTPRVAGKVVQECAIGLVNIDTSGDEPAFVAPGTRISPMAPAEQERYRLALGLSKDDVISAICLDNGPQWNVLELRDARTVLAIDAARVQWPEYAGLSVIGAHPSGHACAYETRNLAPSSGMSEDPITGSLNAALACWLRDRGSIADGIVISQGTCLGRTGRVSVRPSGRDLLIGGHVNILIDGHLAL